MIPSINHANTFRFAAGTVTPDRFINVSLLLLYCRLNMISPVAADVRVEIAAALTNGVSMSVTPNVAATSEHISSVLTSARSVVSAAAK